MVIFDTSMIPSLLFSLEHHTLKGSLHPYTGFAEHSYQLTSTLMSCCVLCRNIFIWNLPCMMKRVYTLYKQCDTFRTSCCNDSNFSVIAFTAQPAVSDLIGKKRASFDVFEVSPCFPPTKDWNGIRGHNWDLNHNPSSRMHYFSAKHRIASFHDRITWEGLHHLVVRC